MIKSSKIKNTILCIGLSAASVILSSQKKVNSNRDSISSNGKYSIPELKTGFDTNEFCKSYGINMQNDDYQFDKILKVDKKISNKDRETLIKANKFFERVFDKNTHIFVDNFDCKFRDNLGGNCHKAYITSDGQYGIFCDGPKATFIDLNNRLIRKIDHNLWAHGHNNYEHNIKASLCSISETYQNETFGDQIDYSLAPNGVDSLYRLIEENPSLNRLSRYICGKDKEHVILITFECIYIFNIYTKKAIKISDLTDGKTYACGRILSYCLNNPADLFDFNPTINLINSLDLSQLIFLIKLNQIGYRDNLFENYQFKKLIEKFHPEFQKQIKNFLLGRNCLEKLISDELAKIVFDEYLSSSVETFLEELPKKSTEDIRDLKRQIKIYEMAPTIKENKLRYKVRRVFEWNIDNDYLFETQNKSPMNKLICQFKKPRFLIVSAMCIIVLAYYLNSYINVI